MLIHQIKDLSNTRAVNLLEQGMIQVLDFNLIKNYHPDYHNESSNLFYILKHGRYQIGNYYIAEENGKYIASAGWNYYEDDIALALTRAYVLPEHRQSYILGTHFLPKILDETVNYDKIWITCNEYNLAIYKGLSRMSQNKNAGLGISWPAIYNKFLPIGIKTVNYTEQYVAEYNRVIHD
jgi:hypothetical protein